MFGPSFNGTGFLVASGSESANSPPQRSLISLSLIKIQASTVKKSSDHEDLCQSHCPRAGEVSFFNLLSVAELSLESIGT